MIHSKNMNKLSRTTLQPYKSMNSTPLPIIIEEWLTNICKNMSRPKKTI